MPRSLHTPSDIPRDLVRYWLGPSWTFAVALGLKHRYGQCSYKTKTISISGPVLFAAWGLPDAESTLCDMVLHEIAHAAAFEASGDTGHGSAWHFWCRVLGCNLDHARDRRANDLCRAAAGSGTR